jgi:transposase-like protein
MWPALDIWVGRVDVGQSTCRIDHSSINRLTIRFLPLFEKVFRKHKCPVGGSWRMDETYIKVKGV